MEGSSGASALPGSRKQLPELHPAEPSTSSGSDKNRYSELSKTFEIMQNFMVKKGILDSTMSPEEMDKFLEQETHNE